MTSIIEMLVEQKRQDSQPAAKKLPLPEVQVATLKEALLRYIAGCPFKAGDIVTPRSGFGYTDVGVPHIVLEVAACPIRVFDLSSQIRSCSSEFGERLDVRVACHRADGNIAPFWMESWRLELYGEGPAP